MILVTALDEADYWSRDFLKQATLQQKKAHIRRMIRQQKDEDDWPTWASVERETQDGGTERVYKQETLFNMDDYRMVVQYHRRQKRHHARMEEGYRKRAKQRFGEDPALPFGD